MVPFPLCDSRVMCSFSLLPENYPKLSSLTQHPVTMSQGLGVRRPGVLWGGSFAQGLTGRNQGVRQGCDSYLRLGSTSKLTGCWQNSVLCYCKTKTIHLERPPIMAHYMALSLKCLFAFARPTEECHCCLRSL